MQTYFRREPKSLKREIGVFLEGDYVETGRTRKLWYYLKAAMYVKILYGKKVEKERQLFHVR